MLDISDTIWVLQLLFQALVGVGGVVGVIVALALFLSFCSDLLTKKCNGVAGWVILATVMLLASMVQIWVYN